MHANSMTLWVVVIVGALVVIGAVCFIISSLRRAHERKAALSSGFISLAEFEERRVASNYEFESGPGCYVILLFDKPVDNGDFSGFDDVYVGRASNMAKAVKSCSVGKGNADVYAAISNGKHAYVQFRGCSPEETDAVEAELIEAFNAAESYNKSKDSDRGRRIPKTR